MGNEEQRGPWPRSSNNTTKEKRKGSNRRASFTQIIRTKRPSDSILFYQDVEATIERVPAATLETFIAMKTKAINNSVREWAKRSTGKVKSIVDWIRVGGKNNTESIDRIEKRLRDYY